MITKTHHFFTLAPNPWPLISSLLSFNLLFSLLVFLKFSEEANFLLNLLAISIASFTWWFSYRGEFNLEGKSSFLLEKGLKMSIILFISSEIFFFFSFFWSYFQFFLSPTIETGLTWPPFAVEIFDCFNVPLINTLVLIRSGLTVTLRHFFLIESDIKFFRLNLFLTISLGFFFRILQVIEYSSSFFSIRDCTFGTSFFMLTGFHGIHVLIGSLFLFSCFLRGLKLSTSHNRFLGFEIASWYWHFVDVVWIFLFFFLYYLNY